MSVLSPWGFGVHRSEIELLVRELVLLATALPDDRVFVVDQGARTPEAPRPFCGITIGDPIISMKTGGDTRIFEGLERWLVTVTDATDGIYSVTSGGMTFKYTASGDTVTSIRDGLVASAGVPVGWTIVAVGTDQIQIDSTVRGQTLLVSAVPPTLTVAFPQGAAEIWRFEPLELQVDVECNGLMSIEAPLATQTGQWLGDQVQMYFDNREMTEKMRDCGHCPTRISRFLLPGVLTRQQQNASIVQIVIRTTGRFATTAGVVLSAPTEPVVTQ